jgi:cell division protein FtsB
MTTRRTNVTGRAVIVICVLAALAITLAVPVRELLSQRAQIDALSNEVATAEQRVDELAASVADWDDPAYVAAQARTRLRFVFPGEVGYVVLGADDRPLPPEPEATEPDRLDPWFLLVWDSVRDADAIEQPEPADAG